MAKLGQFRCLLPKMVCRSLPRATANRVPVEFPATLARRHTTAQQKRRAAKPAFCLDATHRTWCEEFCPLARSVARSGRIAREHARRRQRSKGPHLLLRRDELDFELRAARC